MLSFIKKNGINSEFCCSFAYGPMFQRMKRGEIYRQNPDVQEAYKNGLRLSFKLNQIDPTDQESKRKVLKELFGYESDAIVQQNFLCEFGVNVKVGKNVFFNVNCSILDSAPVEIGDNVLIGPSCTIATAIHPTSPSMRKAEIEWARPIKIGNNVWLGSNVCVGPGVTIGDNSVIGMGSVVVRDIPPNTVAVGNPARVIKTLKEHEDVSKYIEELDKVK